MYFQRHPLDRAFRGREVRGGPEESKPRTSVIGVRGIEYKPTVAGPDNVA